MFSRILSAFRRPIDSTPWMTYEENKGYVVSIEPSDDNSDSPVRKTVGTIVALITFSDGPSLVRVPFEQKSSLAKCKPFDDVLYSVTRIPFYGLLEYSLSLVQSEC